MLLYTLKLIKFIAPSATFGSRLIIDWDFQYEFVATKRKKFVRASGLLSSIEDYTWKNN